MTPITTSREENEMFVTAVRPVRSNQIARSRFPSFIRITVRLTPQTVNCLVSRFLTSAEHFQERPYVGLLEFLRPHRQPGVGFLLARVAIDDPQGQPVPAVEADSS